MKRIYGILVCVILLLTAAFLPFSSGAAYASAADRLSIDNTHLYDGMDKTYEQGYTPSIIDGKAIIVLPLTSRVVPKTVNVKVDLGTIENSPLEFINWSQTVSGVPPYVFTLEIPLTNDRVNGVYPVVLVAEYMDGTDNLVQQQFSVYVTIADKTASTVMSIYKNPELFIKSCVVDPSPVGGDTEFSVNIVTRNLGLDPAQNVCLTYGGVDNSAIVPAQTNNVVFLGHLAGGADAATSVKLKTTKDVSSGNYAFYLTLDYSDLEGGAHSVTRQFLVDVTQPAKIGYDPISVPESVAAGETITFPANVFNMGESTLRNVTVSASGAGLFPTSSVFLGDILPGEAGYGSLEVFVGMLSMTQGYTDGYGTTNGTYTIAYSDDSGEEHAIALDFTTEIIKPIPEIEEAEKILTKEPALQWWVTILVGFAIIAVIVASTVVAQVTRALKVR